MSSVYTRLHRIFSSTQKSTNPIKFQPKTPRTSLVSIKQPNPTKTDLIKDLLSENDSKKLLQKYISLSKKSYFRKQLKLNDMIIHRFTVAKQFPLIEEALESQKIYLSGDDFFAAHIISLYGKAGMFDHAHKVFDELPERKCDRGTRSFNALLFAAAKSQKLDKVIELFREIPSKLSIKPSKDCYSTAAYAFCKLGMIDDAVLLLDDMEANGLKPMPYFFNKLMAAYNGKGNFVEGGKIWERMIKCGVEPNMCSYGYKTLGLVKEGKLVEAVELVEELKCRKLKPNLQVYNALIYGFCNEDDLDGARKWYDELLKHDCMPNKTTFYILVPFLCKKGDYKFAFKVCEEKFKTLCSVNEATLQDVVDGLVKNKMISEATKLVELGRCNSYFPYNLVIAGE